MLMFQKNYKKFVNTLKISQMQKEIAKLEKDYEDFKLQKEKIENRKYMKLKDAINKLETHFNKWKNIRRWNNTPDFTNYDGTQIRTDAIDKFVNEVLLEETRKAYDNS